MKSLTKRKYLIIIVAIMAIFSCRVLFKKTREVEADIIPIEDVGETDIVPKEEPTGDVKKFLGMWMTSGYALQPNENTYTVQGRSVTLYTDAARSVSAVLISPTSWPHYQWYSSNNGKKWTKMDSPSSDKRDLVVSSNTIGTTYYQLRTAWYMLLGPSFKDPIVWSKVATVHTLAKDIDAEKIDVTLDDDYLYNDDTSEITNTKTYAKAIPTPINYTGPIKWSVDRPDLATIDEKTGLITANTRSQSGPVVVTATGENADGQEIEGTKELNVGGGLMDQTVHVGEKATFALMGNIGELDEGDASYTIRWFKEDPMTGEQSEIKESSNDVSHTTADTTINDDGAEYFATITVNTKNGSDTRKSYEYDTNKARLYVTSDEGPQLEMNDSIENATFDEKSDDNLSLYDVIDNDEVNYHTFIKNNSTGARVNDSTYTLPLRKNSKIESVLIDGQEISSDDYEVGINSDNDDEMVLMIKNLKFGINESHDIEVKTRVEGVSKREDYSSIGYLSGVDNSGNKINKIGSSRGYNLVTDKLEFDVNNIEYGQIKPIESEKTVYRKNDASNWPNNIMNVDDMRRNKTAVKLYIKQRYAFQNDQDTLQGHLKYTDGEMEKDLLNDTAVVSETQDGQKMTSLSWRADKGVLLELDNNINASGDYKTELDWDFVDSV